MTLPDIDLLQAMDDAGSVTELLSDRDSKADAICNFFLYNSGNLSVAYTSSIRIKNIGGYKKVIVTLFSPRKRTKFILLGTPVVPVKKAKSIQLRSVRALRCNWKLARFYYDQELVTCNHKGRL